MKRKVVLLAFVSLLLFSAMFEAQFVEAKSWTTTEVVSTESTDGSHNPSLAVDSSGNVHVAWDDYTDYAGCGTKRDIFYKNCTSSWSTTEVVSTESTSHVMRPSLAVDSSGNVHVAWDDWTDYAGCGTDYDIFYKNCTSSWSTTEVVSTESTGGSHEVSLAVDSSGNVHVAWEDATDYSGCGTDYDIFYKRFEVPPPTSVGGIYLPVDKLALLAPYIGLTILLAVAVITVVYVKKKEREIQRLAPD